MLLPKRKIVKLNPYQYRKLCEYVAERDGYRCVVCGNPYGGTPSHIIRRSMQRLDTPQNVVQMCCIRQDGSEGCHQRFERGEVGLKPETIAMLEQEPERL